MIQPTIEKLHAMRLKPMADAFKAQLVPFCGVAAVVVARPCQIAMDICKQLTSCSMPGIAVSSGGEATQPLFMRYEKSKS